jgi:homoserine acetyltransferase
MQELHQQLAGPKTLVELSSLYGHDAFLKEVDALRAVFAQTLA